MRLRNKILLVLCILVACPALASARDLAGSLVKVDLKGVALQDLVKDIAVVREMGTHAYAVGAPAEIQALREKGISVAILDGSVSGKEYFIVSLKGPALLERVRSAGAVLDFDGVNALVRISRAKAIGLVSPGIEIAHLDLEAIKVPGAERALAPVATLSYNPVVQAIVDSVSQANLESTAADLVAFGTRESDTAGGVAASQYLFAKYQSFGITDVQYHSFDSNADNVVAKIPGTVFPENVYVIGGHYDSITGSSNAPGADDNGSGTAAIVEAARILGSYHFENTIVFVNFASEEYGLYGSSAYARLADDTGMNVLGMLNLDMIGYLKAGDTADVDLITNTSSSDLQALAGWATQQYVPSLPWVNGSLPFGASSDHVSFWNHGFKAILYFEDSQNDSPYIHSTNDTIGLSLNNFPFAANCARSVIATLATLAAPVDDIAIGHTPLADSSSTTTPYPVVARVVATYGLAAGSPKLSYSTGSGYTDVVMTPTGNPDEYQANVPAQPLNTTVQYYLSAADTNGTGATLPESGSAAPFTFRVKKPSVCGNMAYGSEDMRLASNRVMNLGLYALPVAFIVSIRLIARRRRV